jgi:hypothetical protein
MQELSKVNDEMFREQPSAWLLPSYRPHSDRQARNAVPVKHFSYRRQKTHLVDWRDKSVVFYNFGERPTRSMVCFSIGRTTFLANKMDQSRLHPRAVPEEVLINLDQHTLEFRKKLRPVRQLRAKELFVNSRTSGNHLILIVEARLCIK